MIDHKIKRLIPYLLLISFLSLFSVFMGIALQNHDDITQSIPFQIILVGSMLLIGYYIKRIAPITAMPSYVWTILAGMAIQPLLMFFNHHILDLTVIMEICAGLIFFTVGLEIPFHNLKKWFLPIASLSVLGLIASSMGFAALAKPILGSFGITNLSIVSLIMLGAALSAVDPTAIMPSLKKIHLKKTNLLQIEESMFSDITGTVLTRILLLLLISTQIMDTSISGYILPFRTVEISYILAIQLVAATLVSFIGFFILQKWYKRNGEQHALLLGIPLLTLGLANIIAGSGILASFLTGLLADISGEMKKASHYYDHILESFIKPFVFILLGTLTPVYFLLTIAPIGIALGLLFIFIIRPLVSMVSLFPWILEHKLKMKEVVFLSFTRESGVVTALLLIIASELQLIQGHSIIALGTWVILLTLVIEPPFIPYLAHVLKLTKKP